MINTMILDPWILHKSKLEFILNKCNPGLVTRKTAQDLCDLFDQNFETCYIARYRSDVHRGMTAEQIQKAMEGFRAGVNLNREVIRQMEIITSKVNNSVEKEVIKDRFRACQDKTELDELVSEFQTPAELKMKANVARTLGLEPTALSIMAGEFVKIDQLCCEAMKTTKEVTNHLRSLLADLVNKTDGVKSLAKRIGNLGCVLEPTSSNRCPNSKKRSDRCACAEECEMVVISQPTTATRTMSREDFDEYKYRKYVSFRRDVRDTTEHDISALERTQEKGGTKWSVKVKPDKIRNFHPMGRKKVHHLMQQLFNSAVERSLLSYFVPKVQRTAQKYLLEKAKETAYEVFRENVDQLFSQEGVTGRFVIALDPGSFTKAAFLTPNGEVIDHDSFSIEQGETRDQDRFGRKGRALLMRWATMTDGVPIVIAIGNGKNTYTTQCAVANMIGADCFPVDTAYCVVFEHGASHYSVSPAAFEEFGDLDICLTSAISIGRRLIDPMSEYVKIEPKHMGKGQYQHSVDENRLVENMAMVVRDKVSSRGANVNISSKWLLRHISGLDLQRADAIVKHRTEKGEFRSREELKQVPGIDADVFQRCSGFLMVPNSTNPLDETIVHPQDYEVAEVLIAKMRTSVAAIRDEFHYHDTTMLEEKEYQVFEMIRDRPKRTPAPPLHRSRREPAADTSVVGFVTNVTTFAVFVDVGYERDGYIPLEFYMKRNERTGERKLMVDLPYVGQAINVIVSRIQTNEDGELTAVWVRPVNAATVAQP